MPSLRLHFRLNVDWIISGLDRWLCYNLLWFALPYCSLVAALTSSHSQIMLDMEVDVFCPLDIFFVLL